VENPWKLSAAIKFFCNINAKYSLGKGEVECSIHSGSTSAHHVLCSKAEICSQSFFMLMTVQFWAVP